MPPIRRSPEASRPALHAVRVLLACILALGATNTLAAHISVRVDGIDGELKDAVLAGLEIAHYGDRAVTPAQAHRLYARAEEQAAKSLEPYGYYDPTITGELTQVAGDWLAVLHVTPGTPVKVTRITIALDGTASGQKPVEKALEGFAPAKGQTLNHATYERSKAAIQAALYATGFLDAKLVTHVVKVTRASASAEIELAWQVGPRYRFGATRFTGGQFPDSFMERFIPWHEGDFYSQDKLLGFQQRLVDADYFAIAQVQPDREQAHDGIVPVSVMLAPAKRTLYTGGIFVGTDTGPGLRGGIERRWVNQRGHKLKFDVLAAQRLKTGAVLYQVPLAGPDDHSLNFGANWRDEDTDTSASRTFSLAATDSRLWHDWTRTLGLKFLTGSYTVSNIRGDTTLLYPEATLSRKNVDDPMFVRRGWGLTVTARAAQEGLVSDTSFVQAIADAKWIRGIGENSRFIARGTLGATSVDDFSKLPPELRFFAGGDRSIRGYGYQTIGPPLPAYLVPVAEAYCAANPSRRCQSMVIGGRNLIVASAEYEYYFKPRWGIAAFVDTGDAFSDRNDYQQKTGVGIGARWRSPVGMIRIDLGFPVNDKDAKAVELHLVIGPDL